MNASQYSATYSYPPGVTLGPSAPVVQHAHAPSLGSNNPFRNRALSPSASSFSSAGRPERPTSTNPFDDLDSPHSAPIGGTMVSPVGSQDMTSNTRDLFENLSLNPATQPAAQPAGFRPAPPRPEKPAPNGYSSERRDRPERRARDHLDIFADPPRNGSGSRPSGRDRPRPRRNSESSIMERPKHVDTEEERKRRERRRREREARGKEGKDGKPRSSSSKKNNYQLDIIDKLDVTSIYGTGMFHHDGPFDACNPNRNRKGVRTAPMQAFPKDSANMALGGSGPNNLDIDHNLFHGRTEEGFNDFAASARSEPRRAENPPNFDPTARIEPVHGSESMGLGTSTFLEGAPVSQAELQRRGTTSEGSGGGMNGGGLQRKKSLAQRLRGINRAPSGRSPEATYSPPVPAGHIGTIKANEKNPFFQDYDDAWEKKGAQITSSEEARDPVGGRARSSSSPKQNTGLERRFTNERSYGGYDENKNAGGGGSGGFINRMKSLRKPRPERRVTND
ncbi:hypothetical protein ASPACDRAFT_64320 [Aspergillus aculeatus ATCC 16872]|uniref:Pal1-domain-containing protein n=1 Tax=Aspergillus aculeatus (strain ATCC 16872 / CBS 172.66 / WB 5094) TaxID=690307 RepID=A0A1L9WGU3_ASPA1|nr:uncharacterized protein ASPACDRAFT_64320 [Aspergillus aculeatus ATCC 16872]OJJ95404.1 hypothetical protein ASPACDRAFT_64320 [Aspergillus aculeatus ATCC 16872]